MKILITGGSGYVGSRLTYFLLEKYDDMHIYNYDLSFFGDKSNNLAFVIDDPTIICIGYKYKEILYTTDEEGTI